MVSREFICKASWGLALITFVLINLYSVQDRPAIKYEAADSLIKTEKFGKNILLVSLGYDAVTAVNTENGLVIIDGGISKSLTGKYRKIIEREFPGKKIVYLINTHSHIDHTAGNQVFADAIIIGHKNCPAEMTEQGKALENTKLKLPGIIAGYEKELDTIKAGSKEWEEALTQKIRYQYAYDDIMKGYKITPPTVTFTDSLNLDLGDTTMEAFYFGQANSASDIVIHFPRFRLLMTGDLFFKGGIPSFRNSAKGDSLQWEKTLKWISARIPISELIIDGHGDVMARDDLKAFIAYIEKLLR